MLDTIVKNVLCFSVIVCIAGKATTTQNAATATPTATIPNTGWTISLQYFHPPVACC